MKRIICTVICILMALSKVANADTIKEIRFRGIEWGTDYITVMSTFDDSIKWKKPESSSAYSMEYEMTEDFREKKRYNGPVSCVVTTKFYFNNLEVAGYPVTESELYFAYTPNANGDYNEELEQTAFYMAYYSFVDFEDAAAANEDLLSKLTQLYGDPVESYIEEDTDYPDVFRRWNGEKDTSCVYTRSYTADYDITKIYYGWMAGEQLLSEANDYYAVIAAQEQAISAEAAGTEGL